MSSFGWSWQLEWQSPCEFHAHLINRVIVDLKTEFQRIMVVEFATYGKALIIDGKIQSSVADEFIYHETLVHPLLLSIENPKNVLILGGGEGATLREVLKNNLVEKATMVDIDKAVIDFAKQYLTEWHQGSFDNKRANIVISDAKKFIDNTTESYDAIVLDLTDPIKGNTSYKLYTKEFYEEIKHHLNKGGAIVTQATSPSFSLDVFSTIMNTLRNTFKLVSASIVYVPSFDGLWGFVYASDYVNPIVLTRDQIDKKIKERIVGELRFYDGETHNTIFNIPKHIRKVIQQETRISTENNPIYVPA
ncbi:polyamine aminopropyltransferase [Acidianus manzaensis]|uniref:Polyamine aminopropyltransferase n=1 Tax=Acidianus manzaensis TaxID=282676 RepID=A0A1W6K056_9CREN|nr:polyamine aminopropyltransferase [Acidianus manzaensis]ARM75898.1 spermidine synthase [Acidianus manzaensis]